MTTLLFRPTSLLRLQSLGLGLSLGAYCTYQAFAYRPIRLDTIGSGAGSGGRGGGGGVFSSGGSGSGGSSKSVAETLRREGGLSSGVVRQVSSGSVIGLVAGLAVSTFSKPLALILGLMVVGVQWASSYGINVIPYQRLQRYFNNIDIRSVVQDNVAFKVSFGTTFALAAFMQF